ncbi:hypothetical protein EZJ43_13990 [Pedobacter changchengzhani]|uniref:Peptidyl-prolyl cis-trans isomerase n=1 Tax=Pedobacter changchengzhani TaxID=2529274 RepID=A0A4R5MJN8_9SPHI|nr:FKBP-type peptidyl-prolyl cis-trans isomerase [Pedobacter changchengzhani]TDG35405.1 hypothetical protein EZJ43_13990 [Pedobacter changchengzhani]
MKNFNKLSLIALLFSIVFLTSCKKEYDSIQIVDDAAIQTYIQKNNLTGLMKADPDGSGFYYQVLDPGTGNTMANKDSVLFNYQYKSLTNGNTFFGTPANSNNGTYLGYLAEPNFPNAFRQSLQGLKYGAKVRVIIPSYLAFGKNGSTSVNIGSNEIIDAYINTFSTNKQWELDDTKIQTFLTAKSLTAVKDPSRVYYITSNPGTGTDVITKESTLVVKYTGRLLDGTVFDSSTDGTFSTTLNSVVRGWSVLTNLKAGGKMRIFIPSDLGYGTAGSFSQVTGAQTIPSNAILDFDIEIVSVTN